MLDLDSTCVSGTRLLRVLCSVASCCAHHWCCPRRIVETVRRLHIYLFLHKSFGPTCGYHGAYDRDKLLVSLLGLRGHWCSRERRLRCRLWGRSGMINLRTTAFWSAGLPFCTHPFPPPRLLPGSFVPGNMAIELINCVVCPEFQPNPSLTRR